MNDIQSQNCTSLAKKVQNKFLTEGLSLRKQKRFETDFGRVFFYVGKMLSLSKDWIEIY